MAGASALAGLVVERPEKVVYRLHHLCLDQGYDYAEVIEGIQERDYHLHVAKSKADKVAIPTQKKHPARRWVKEPMASGTYLYRLVTDEFS